MDDYLQEVDALLEAVRALLQGGTSGMPRHAYNALEHCERVLARLAIGKEGIPARLCLTEVLDKEERDSIIGPVRRDREALLQILTVVLLNELLRSASFADSTDQKAPLICALSRTRDTVPPGLKLDQHHGLEKESGGFANSHEAREFFDHYLGQTVERMDLEYGADFSSLRESHPSDWEKERVSAEVMWTQATAAVATEWLFDLGGGTLAGIVHVLLSGTIPEFRAKKNLSGASLPSGNKQFRFELWARPLLCQIISHTPNLAAPPHGPFVYLHMKELARQEVRGERYFTGLRIAHVYLAVWIERVIPHLGLSSTQIPMPKPPTFNLPDDLARDIAPAHQAPVAALIALFENPWASRRRAGSWFVPPESPLEKPRNIEHGSGNDSAEEGAYSPFDDPLSPVYDITDRVDAQPAQSAQSELIGSVHLSWSDLSIEADAEWIAMVLIVRHKQQWHALVMELEEDDEEDDSQEGRFWLSAAPELVKPWGYEALRNVLPSAKWVYQTVGAGLLVAGSIVLD